MAQFQPSTPEEARRYELDDILKSLLPQGGALYFQPKENITMVYPCILYQKDYTETSFADNHPWRIVQRYQVTIMDKNPDSNIAVKVSQLPMSIFERHFTKGDLNHDIYRLYF